MARPHSGRQVFLLLLCSAAVHLVVVHLQPETFFLFFYFHVISSLFFFVCVCLLLCNPGTQPPRNLAKKLHHRALLDTSASDVALAV